VGGGGQCVIVNLLKNVPLLCWILTSLDSGAGRAQLAWYNFGCALKGRCTSFYLSGSGRTCVRQEESEPAGLPKRMEEA
jgi:hypothetical protein